QAARSIFDSHRRDAIMPGPCSSLLVLAYMFYFCAGHKDLKMSGGFAFRPLQCCRWSCWLLRCASWQTHRGRVGDDFWKKKGRSSSHVRLLDHHMMSSAIVLYRGLVFVNDGKDHITYIK